LLKNGDGTYEDGYCAESGYQTSDHGHDPENLVVSRPSINEDTGRESNQTRSNKPSRYPILGSDRSTSGFDIANILVGVFTHESKAQEHTYTGGNIRQTDFAEGEMVGLLVNVCVGCEEEVKDAVCETHVDCQWEHDGREAEHLHWSDEIDLP
jgi:hypothetical protein